MEIASNVKRFILKISFFSLVCCVLLWFSLFLYGLLYYVYIPAVAHVKHIYFRYDASCKKDSCKYPYYNLTLVDRGSFELLTRGQAYTIEIILDLPESERNINQGVFMVRLDMMSENGDVLQSSLRPALLRYKSPLFKVIYTLFFVPGLLVGTVEEKQSMVVPLFEKYMEVPYQPTHFAYVEIQAPKLEIYSATLRIHAQFTGLRYFMYYWPVLSTVIGVGSNFSFLSIIVMFIWIRQIMNNFTLENKENFPSSEESLLLGKARSAREKLPKLLEEQKMAKPEGGGKKKFELHKEEVEEIAEHSSDEELASSLRQRKFTSLQES